MGIWDELFGRVTPHHLNEALAVLHDVTVDPGECLMLTGDDDRALLIVVDGEVAITREGHVIATGTEGAIVGERALFSGCARSASVVALRPTHAVVLTDPGYRALVAANNPVVFRIERQVLTRLGQHLRKLDVEVSQLSKGETLPSRGSLLDRLMLALWGRPQAHAPQVDGLTVLERHPLFQGESHVLLQGLSQSLRPVAYHRGDIVCDPREQGQVALIVDGTADVAIPVRGGRWHRLARVGAGDCVHAAALSDGNPRATSVIASEPVVTLEVSRRQYEQLVRRDGQLQSLFRRAMIRALADQVAVTSGELLALRDPTPVPMSPRALRA